MEGLIENVVRRVLNEEISRQLNEGFKSNKMRQFFQQHGGVKRAYTHGDFMKTPDEMRDEMDYRWGNEENAKYAEKYNATKDDHFAYANQDALGDITDDDIVYMKVFEPEPNEKLVQRGQRPVENRAQNHAWDLNHPVGRDGRRHYYNNNAHYTVYKANDGACVVVGLDPQRVPIGVTWGGHESKKRADRYWNNGEKSRYEDDSDTYYYNPQGRARNFGMHTSKNYQGLKHDHQNLRQRMSPEDFDEYIKGRVQDQKDFLDRHYYRWH